MPSSIYAEYESSDALLAAIECLRGEGYQQLEAYTPYSNEELRRQLGKRRSRLPILVFLGGMIGAGLAYVLQWGLVAYLYPLNVGGRPPHMPLAFFIITFEMGILLAAFTGFFAVLVKAKLLRLYDPVFEIDGIEGVSVDRHWLRIPLDESGHEPAKATQDLLRTTPLRVVESGEAR